MAQNNINCQNLKCSRSKMILLRDISIVPFDIEDTKLRPLFSYFLYHAPLIESMHSLKIDKLKHSSIMVSMFNGRHFEYQNFCSFNQSIEKNLEKGALAGESLCLKCKRFVCKKKKPNQVQSNETDLECFLRHLRNSIAHGRVYYHHAGNRVHIIFDDRNEKGKLTARIVCIKADLEHWKRVLENPNNY